MADIFMYSPNDEKQITIYLYYIFRLKRLDIYLNEPTNQNSPQLLSRLIRKRYYKTLGTSLINSPMSPPSPERIVHVNILCSYYIT